jgi:outer membrane protein assembly factor BamB
MSSSTTPQGAEQERRDKTEPYFAPAAADWNPASQLKSRKTENPLPHGTLGDIGLATEVRGPDRFPQSILVVPFVPKQLVGIDAASVRVFRWEGETKTLQPSWNSGINVRMRFVWAKIDRPGVYVPLGLPRDRLLQEALRAMAHERHYVDTSSREEMQQVTRRGLEVLLKPPLEALHELRLLLTNVEFHTRAGISPQDVVVGRGGHLEPFPLPGNLSLGEFRRRLGQLETSPKGLPEEALFHPPEAWHDREVPWPVRPDVPPPDRWVDPNVLRRLSIFDHINLGKWWPWFFCKDWWMYQHDPRHTGRASGWSNLRSTNVGTLVQHAAVPVDGPVITKPSIVAGKVYVGSGKTGGGSGSTLYKIDLATGAKEGEFPTSGSAFYSWYQGIGGSPAVVNGKVYFTAVHGKVYCVDAASMTPAAPHPPALWVTDLKNPDPAHKQPVNNPNGDSWSGPLVVNGKVYVGSGEGESPATYGFIWCLDAATGDVIWCFCTSKFVNRFAPGTENVPKDIPASVAMSNPLPAWATAAGYTIHPDPLPDRSTGCSVWSSCAYDSTLNRIYVGTGNSQYNVPPGFTTALPDKWYGSGLLSLDADTGEFKGFFQPAVDDSYWPGDLDIDVPGAPTLFSHGGKRVVAFGSKNGSFFLLNAEDLSVIAKRQLLPRTGGSGLPGDRGTGIPTVVPTGGEGENSYGIMGTPALHAGLGRLYVGLGGYNGMHPDPVGIDPTRTPFLRVVDWQTLVDRWATAVGPDNVSRYTVPKPPMYTTLEVGLSSPAVVNDVVFVATNKAALYALDAGTGLCLWSAPGLPAGAFCLGPAIYGNYVAIGAGNAVYIYTLSLIPPHFRPPELEVPWWERLKGWPPPPPPPPDLGDLLGEVAERGQL